MSGNQETGLRVLLSGGGTGGHVFPALSVARELVERGCSVSWLGRSEGMERGLVETANLDYHGVEAKPWVGRGSIDKIGALATLAWSSLKARRLVRSSIDVTVGTGGYVSAPAIVGSFLARRPVVLLEPNAVAGAANRLLSRLSSAACIGYEQTSSQLRCRSYWTGTPVRPEFFTAGAAPRQTPVLLVVGGSQGAMQINDLLPAVIENLSNRLPALKVVHQTGASHLESVGAEYATRSLGEVVVDVVPFIDDMAAAMAGASLVLSRAGALTLAEITASGRPSVLIPLAAAGGHQRDNAAELAARGAAELVSSEQATVAHLTRLLGELFVDEERRARMGEAARALARRDAAEQIADLVELLGRAA